MCRHRHTGKESHLPMEDIVPEEMNETEDNVKIQEKRASRFCEVCMRESERES